MTEMQAKIPFRAKVREVGHVGSGGGVQGSGFRGLGARFQVSRAHLLCPPKIGGRGATLRRGYDKRKTER